MISPARFASGEDPSAGSGISDSGADPPAAPSFVFRKIRQIRPMALAGVHDVKAAFTSRGQDVLNRLDRRPRQREIIAHFVDIPPLPAKVDLHVDHQKKRVLRTQITVVRPTIRVSFYVALFHVRSVKAPGAPERARLLLHVRTEYWPGS